MNLHAESLHSVVNPLVLRCGCADEELQGLVEGVGVDAMVEVSRDVEETLVEFVVGVSRPWTC